MQTHAPTTETMIERIRQRAYQLFQARGQEPGHEEEDWYRAERELLAESPPQAGPSSFPAEAGDAIAERERENEIVRRSSRGPASGRSRESRGSRSADDPPGVAVTAGHGREAHTTKPEEDFEIDGVDPSAIEAPARSRRHR